ncbi:hypothetical protein V6N13_148118 [Hibiscus sabdariffa]|uniref:Uncharacterized protein n=1 Tax=Hibiscus sabdariffa TaxID=183260 RepID=A0ABR2TY86_9ROSI
MTPLTVRFRPEGYMMRQDFVLYVVGSPVDRQGSRIYRNTPSPPSGSSGDDPNYDPNAHWTTSSLVTRKTSLSHILPVDGELKKPRSFLD